MSDIVFSPIGTIRSPHKALAGMPIQPRAALGVRGEVTVFPEYVEGLKDLAGFSHIYLLYHLHRASPYRLRVTPFLDSEPRGVFATRAPSRPNPLGLSIVLLREVRGDTLVVENIDVLDGTPLLDVKPYVPAFDHWQVQSIGWLEGKDIPLRTARSDKRFEDD
ncbi:MAG: tRNA (N6-threonylcarbamoyladenosine(37)-N6)-methyltransferase TrmO [Acidobacteriota bacterium]